MREIVRISRDGIFDAAARGDARMLRALVTLGGADANAADALGCAPVWIAARGGHAAAVRALAACGADVRAGDALGRTPVWIAAWGGHTAAVRALAACRADVRAADENGRTPVFAAAANGHTQTVLALLLEFGADVNAADENGRTPVFAAAESGDAEMVRTLVLCDADVSAADENGWTPALTAAANGHTETVRALAARGADESAADENGWTPVFAAAANGHTETVRALVRECGADPVPALLTAALRADAEMTWMLVSGCGVDPARRNRHGEKALDLVPAGSNEYKLLEWLEGLRNHPPVLGPGASRTDRSLAYEDWVHHRGDAPCKKDNDDKRAAGFPCPVCQHASRDGVAFVPCGHRVCPGCWARMRSNEIHTCPQCRAPIAHGEPQDSWPDRHPLYSRFCVEVPSAWR